MADSRLPAPARRTILGAGVLALATLAAGQAGTPAPVSDVSRELESFLRLLAGERGVPRPLSPVLAALGDALPPAILEEIRRIAAEAAVSPDDYLAYCLAESLPISRRLLSHYVPLTAVFAVARRPRQSALLGAAFLPTAAASQWREGKPVRGLGLGTRPGLCLGGSGSLAVAGIMAPRAEFLGPGLPPPIITRAILDADRSLDGVLDTLQRMLSARPCYQVVCDLVEGSVAVVETGAETRVDFPETGVVVLGPRETGAEVNVEHLRQGVEANLGWLTAEKGMGFLREAVPGATYVVLDLDGRRGLMESEGSRARLEL